MIPTYDEIMLPFLKSISDKEEHSIQEVTESLGDYFKLSEDEKSELLPSGQQKVFRNRVGWARAYLKKACLLESTKRAYSRITKRGLDLLNENPQKITSESLKRYEEFVEFVSVKKKLGNTIDRIVDEPDDKHEKTPEEYMEYAYQRLKSELAGDLIETVKASSPAFFERLVVDLLINMGYGGSRKDAGEALGRTGDGGIDGIIKEDKLGLDIIYIQAKKWERKIPINEVRDFAGALLAKKAQKGIFITTSSFVIGAYEYVKSVNLKIVLIDGDQLAEMMIEHNVGIATVNKYEIKQIDTDYFEEN